MSRVEQLKDIQQIVADTTMVSPLRTPHALPRLTLPARTGQVPFAMTAVVSLLLTLRSLVRSRVALMAQDFAVR